MLARPRALVCVDGRVRLPHASPCGYCYRAADESESSRGTSSAAGEPQHSGLSTNLHYEQVHLVAWRLCIASLSMSSSCAPVCLSCDVALGSCCSWDSQCTIKDPTASLNAEATLNPGATRALPLPPPKTKSRIKLGTAAPPPSASAAQLAKEAERLSATEQASNEQPVAKTLCKFPISHASKRKLVFIRTCSVTMSAPVSAFTKE